jgi:S-adenosyl methyltransferase
MAAGRALEPGAHVVDESSQVALDGLSSDSVVDETVPYPARMWNYWLGGTANFAADREAADQIVAVFPQIVDVAQAARAALRRVVGFLAGEAGVRQFLDVGAGLPFGDVTHVLAQRIAPECRVVYVDNDPLMRDHLPALLTGSAEGATGYVDADVRDSAGILRAAASTLDFSQPVGLVMFGVMGNVGDDEAYRTVRRFVEALPSGSYLALNDGTDGEGRAEASRQHLRDGGPSYLARQPAEIARFFDGLELVEPGVVSTSLWRPPPGASPSPVPSCCGVARKP